MDRRVSVREPLPDDLGKGYDVILLFNILHGFSLQILGLVNSAAARSTPAGWRIVEQIAARLQSGTPGGCASQMSYFHLLGGRVVRLGISPAGSELPALRLHEKRWAL
jgi:hypothetical protein